MEKPSLIAIVLCDQIIEDKWSGKKSLIGVFHNIWVRQLPAFHPSMSVLGSFVGGRGKQPVAFMITSPSGDTIARIEGEADFKDPLAAIDVVFNIQGFPIAEEGQPRPDWEGPQGIGASMTLRFDVSFETSLLLRLEGEPEFEAVFPEPRTVSQMAKEHRDFVASLGADVEDYEDVDLPPDTHEFSMPVALP